MIPCRLYRQARLLLENYFAAQQEGATAWPGQAFRKANGVQLRIHRQGHTPRIQGLKAAIRPGERLSTGPPWPEACPVLTESTRDYPLMSGSALRSLVRVTTMDSMTPMTPSRHLTMSVAQGRMADRIAQGNSRDLHA